MLKQFRDQNLSYWLKFTQLQAVKDEKYATAETRIPQINAKGIHVIQNISNDIRHHSAELFICINKNFRFSSTLRTILLYTYLVMLDVVNEICVVVR